MSPTREKHRKSRGGCRTCKARHVKCDEQRPICNACSRLGFRCAYASALRSPSAPPQSRQPSTPERWTTIDMELLHHYSICGCVRIAPGTSRHQCWMIEVPRLAFSHHFLLHQLIAVSALHCHTGDPTRTELVDVAAHHRARALESVQPSFGEHDLETAIARFAFAGLTAIYAFKEPTTQLSDGDTLTRLLTCFRLTRGIKTMLDINRSDIENSWARIMVDFDATAIDEVHVLGLHFDQMQVLEDMIRTMAHELQLPTDETEACMIAARTCLDRIQVLMQRGNPDCDDAKNSLIMTWPNDVSETYLQALQCQTPTALVILAHYAALMSLGPRLWWFRAWPSQILQHVTTNVDAKWHAILRWPSAILHMRVES